MNAIKKSEQKKVILLGVLLALLVGILSWQWVHRDKPVAFVSDDKEHAALATFLEMLEAGRVRGWQNAGKFWKELPDRESQTYYQRLMGSKFRTEFEFQGSAPVESRPEEIVLYGTFDTGIQVEVLLAANSETYQVISIRKL